MLKTVIKEMQENQRIENLIDEFILRDSIATQDMRVNQESLEFNQILLTDHDHPSFFKDFML